MRVLITILRLLRYQISVVIGSKKNRVMTGQKNITALRISVLWHQKGGSEEEALIEHGCNYYGATVTRSAPFAIFLRQDVLRLALEMDAWYRNHIDIFSQELYYRQPYSRKKDGTVIPYEPVQTIIPGIYGEIAKHANGELYTTKERNELAAVCADLAFIWKKDRIDSTA